MLVDEILTYTFRRFLKLKIIKQARFTKRKQTWTLLSCVNPRASSTISSLDLNSTLAGQQLCGFPPLLPGQPESLTITNWWRFFSFLFPFSLLLTFLFAGVLGRTCNSISHKHRNTVILSATLSMLSDESFILQQITVKIRESKSGWCACGNQTSASKCPSRVRFCSLEER